MTSEPSDPGESLDQRLGAVYRDILEWSGSLPLWQRG